MSFLYLLIAGVCLYFGIGYFKKAAEIMKNNKDKKDNDKQDLN